MLEEMDIIDRLISDIQSGKYESDDKLPSEYAFADVFRVPRITVRKAYERLQELGYIYSKQGIGSFVKDRYQNIPIPLIKVENFSKRIIEQGYNYQSKNIFCEPIEYNHKIYQELEAKPQDKAYKIGRLRIINETPIALHISYVSERMFPDIEKKHHLDV